MSQVAKTDRAIIMEFIQLKQAYEKLKADLKCLDQLQCVTNNPAFCSQVVKMLQGFYKGKYIEKEIESLATEKYKGPNIKIWGVFLFKVVVSREIV